MAMESAKKFLEQMMSDEALRASVAKKDAAGVAAAAKEMGFDLTQVELLQALKLLQQKDKSEPEILSPDDLTKVSGGALFFGDDAPDGHEMGCSVVYHDYQWQKQHNIECKSSHYTDYHFRNECASVYYT